MDAGSNTTEFTFFGYPKNTDLKVFPRQQSPNQVWRSIVHGIVSYFSNLQKEPAISPPLRRGGELHVIP